MILTERIVDKLLSGDLDFLDSFGDFYIDELIKNMIDSPYRRNILFASFDKILKKNLKLAFMISLDLKEYNNFWHRYLEIDYSILLNYECLLMFLLKADWSRNFIYEKLEKLALEKRSVIFAVLRYTVRSGDSKLAEKLAYSNNLELRGLFLKELLETHDYLFYNFYDDIIHYFVNLDEYGNVASLMRESIVSNIASLVLIHGLGEDVYLKIRDFIFNNYETNTLAGHLDGYGKYNMDVFELNKAMLIRDINMLFITSKDYKYELVSRYSEYLDADILKEFISKIEPFIKIDEEAISKIFLSGLGDKFLYYVDKYLEISTGAKVIIDAGVGTCSRVFRVGDYVIKLSTKKWSMEDSLCPSGYLFAKNYEEDIVRKDNGEVTGAVEVQKYLTRPLNVNDLNVIETFLEELKRLGYYIKDVLVDANTGANCYYLDSYLDAEFEDEDVLPEWFKKNPLVLVDRDLVFKLDNENPKLKAINLK